MSNALHAGAKFTCAVCGLETKVESGAASGKSLTVDGHNLLTQNDIRNINLSPGSPNGGGCKNLNAPCSRISSILSGDFPGLRLREGEPVASTVMLPAAPGGLLSFSGYDKSSVANVRLGPAGRAAAAARTPAPGPPRRAEAPDPSAPRSSQRRERRSTVDAPPYWDWVFNGPGPGDIRLRLPLATCAALEAQIRRLSQHREVLRRNPQRAIDDGWRLFQNRRHEYLDRLAKADAGVEAAKLDVGLDLLGLALDASFAILGTVLVTPAAFGTLTAAALLAGPIMLGVQLYFKQDQGVTLIVAYARQRTLLLTEKAIEGEKLLGGHPGKLKHAIGKIASVVALLWSLKDVAEHTYDWMMARDQLNDARRLLRELDETLAPLAETPDAWTRHRDETLSRMIDTLRRYVAATGGADCRCAGPVQPRRLP